MLLQIFFLKIRKADPEYEESVKHMQTRGLTLQAETADLQRPWCEGECNRQRPERRLVRLEQSRQKAGVCGCVSVCVCVCV